MFGIRAVNYQCILINFAIQPNFVTLQIRNKFQNVVFVANIHLYIVHSVNNIIVLNIFTKNTIIVIIMLNNLVIFFILNIYILF
jgi:hypothetical protein